jgi:hypothetical protein
VRHAHVAGEPARPGGLEGLGHELGRPDAFQHGVGADAGGEVLDPGHALRTALGDDVGGAELDRQLLPGRVPAHGDDPPGALVRGRQHPEQADRAVTDHGGLILDYDAPEIPADPGQTIVAYTAEPGSPSHQALNLLASWAAARDPAPPVTAR